MAREIGFGVVGLGMGRHHCTAVNRAEGARLVAICDADEERLDTGTEEYGCRGYTDYESFLADEAVEVVNIATPSGSHAQLAIPAAGAGKHLIVEKPADITVERVDAMIAACEANGVKAAGIFQARFNTLNIRIREAVAAGRLGRLIGVHGHLPWYRTGEYYRRGPRLVEGHLEDGRRGVPDEPGGPHRRPAAVVCRKGRERVRAVRHLRPRHRGRRPR